MKSLLIFFCGLILGAVLNSSLYRLQEHSLSKSVEETIREPALDHLQDDKVSNELHIDAKKFKKLKPRS